MDFSNGRDRRDATDYVRRISSDIQNGARELISENERLRGNLAAHEVELEQLRSELEAARSEVAPLREQRDAAEQRARRLEQECQVLRGSVQGCEEERRHLRDRISRVDEENRRVSDGFVGLTEQNTDLANLYVAAYRLHSALDRADVVAILKEILANLIGSEEMALFAAPAGADTLTLTDWSGIDPEPWRSVALGTGIVGQVAVTGSGYFRRDETAQPGRSEDRTLTVCIPLKLEARVSGVLAVFRLLPQKLALAPIDMEIFELLATHAASALYCAELHRRFTSGHGTEV